MMAKIIDEVLHQCLLPIFGNGQVYAHASPEILERDITHSFRPFAIFRVAGGDDFRVLERFANAAHHDKDLYNVQLEVWAPRISDARRLALQARNAIIACPDFLGVYREGGMYDRNEFLNKLFGIFQEFAIWHKTP